MIMVSEFKNSFKLGENQVFKWALLFYLLTFISDVQCTCDQGHFSCETPDGKYGTCTAGTCIVIQPEVRNDLRLSIIVKYPEETLQVHGGRNLYMRGNAFGFSWKEGVRLNKTGRDTWRGIITYQSDSNGIRCQYCDNRASLTDANFEYRIYIDDSTDMIGGNLHLKLPISKSSGYFDEIPIFIAYPWFFSQKGVGNVVIIESPQIGKNRSIVIYTPPSFYENTFKAYPVLIVFDLNEELYNVSADLINAPIVEKETVGEHIMVGFGDYIHDDERMDLLTQVSGSGFPYLCINGSLADSCDHCVPADVKDFKEHIWYMRNKCGRLEDVGGKGNDTLDFLIKTVLPKAKEFTKDRMRTDQPNLGVMGYSLGGLMACHAAWTRPKIFGFAACQSPSFWWPGIKNYTEAGFFFNNDTMKDPDLRNNRPSQKIYLDAGGTETLMPFSLTQAMLSAAQDMGTTGFFEWDKNLWANVFPEDVHSSTTWVSRMWSPLRIFFPANPGPRLKNEIISKCPSDTNGTSRKDANVITSLHVFLLVTLVQSLLNTVS